MFKIGYKEHSRALNLLISGARILGSGKTRQEQNAVWFDIKRSSLEAQLVKNPPAIRRPWVDSSVEKICWRRDRLPAPVFLGFSHGSAGKESACDAGDLGSIPGLGGSPGEGKGYPHRCSGLENSMDCLVHGVSKSWTWLSNFHFIPPHLT